MTSAVWKDGNIRRDSAVFISIAIILVTLVTLFIGDYGIAAIIGLFFLLLLMYVGNDAMSMALIVIVIVTHHYSYIIGLNSLIRDRNIILFLALVVYGSDKYVRGGAGYISRTPRSLMIVIVFIIGFMLWGIVKGNKRVFLWQDTSWFLSILSYFPLAQYFSKRINIDHGINVLLAVTSIMSMGAVLQFYRTNHRSISNAEMFIPIAIMIALALVLYLKQTLRYKAMLLCVLLINSFGVFVSLTRSLWISLILGLFLIVALFFAQNRQRISGGNVRRVVASICLLLSLVFIMLYANAPLWDQVVVRFKMIFMGGYDISTLYRLLEMKEMVLYLKDHLVIGDGMGAVVSIPFSLTTQGRISNGTPYMHNTFLYWVLKFGLFFSFIWLAMWYRIIKDLVNHCTWETDAGLKAIKIGLLLGLFTITVFSMAAPVLSASTGMFYLGFVLAVFYPGKRIRR